MRILQISTHTTLRPRHGGQLRSHHIGRVVEAAGHTLRRLAVAYRGPDDPIDPREPIVEISRSKYWWRLVKHGPMELNDFFSLQAVLEEPSLAEQTFNAIRAADPEVIMLEHPWMWPLVKRLDGVASGQIDVIYNSQNVEVDLKRRILAEAGHGGVDDLLGQVEQLESDLVRSSAATSACTKSDADVYLSWGAKRVVIANNGAILPEYDQLVGVLPRALNTDMQYAFVVASNHPPNLAGLKQFVAPALKYLRPLQRIVVAGGVCSAFGAWLNEHGFMEMADGRLVLLGPVGELELKSAIANASVLLLPIPYGGGSNVKTAEALLSRKRVIATPAALRGFADFRDLPAIKMVTTEPEFVQALLCSFEAAPPGEQGSERLESLLWENTLAPLLAVLREIKAAKAAPAQ